MTEITLVKLYAIIFMIAMACLCTNAEDELCFPVIGDIGGMPRFPYQTTNQRKVAKLLAEVSEKLNCQFIVGVGDNFYFEGVRNVRDPRFYFTYERTYTAPSLVIPWYMIAGNHDHISNVSAQIMYSKLSKRWNFLDFYYTKVFRIPNTSEKTLQLVMVDTTMLCWHNRRSNAPTSDAQFKWIEDTLKNSNATFLVVAGHHPIFSSGSHGNTECLVKTLKPLLEKYEVSAYFSGHDHNLQYVKEPNSKIHYFVSGSGNFADGNFKNKHKLPKDSISWQDGDNGFMNVCATQDKLKIDVYKMDEKSPINSTSIFPRQISNGGQHESGDDKNDIKDVGYKIQDQKKEISTQDNARPLKLLISRVPHVINNIDVATASKSIYTSDTIRNSSMYETDEYINSSDRESNNINNNNNNENNDYVYAKDNISNAKNNNNINFVDVSNNVNKENTISSPTPLDNPLNVKLKDLNNKNIKKKNLNYTFKKIEQTKRPYHPSFQQYTNLNTSPYKNTLPTKAALNGVASNPYELKLSNGLGKGDVPGLIPGKLVLSEEQITVSSLSDIPLSSYGTLPSSELNGKKRGNFLDLVMSKLKKFPAQVTDTLKDRIITDNISKTKTLQVNKDTLSVEAKHSTTDIFNPLVNKSISERTFTDQSSNNYLYGNSPQVLTYFSPQVFYNYAPARAVMNSYYQNLYGNWNQNIRTMPRIYTVSSIPQG